MGEYDGLRRNIQALLDLDLSGNLAPHGIGGHARELLTQSDAALTSLQERLAQAEAELRASDPNYTPLLDKYAADIQAYADRAEKAERELAELRAACAKENDDICQTLGKVLGYPWFKDDQKNFPGATDENGVCVGEHVAASIAAEAAKRLAQAERELAEAASANEFNFMAAQKECGERLVVEERLAQAERERDELAAVVREEMRSAGHSEWQIDQKVREAFSRAATEKAKKEIGG